jgi:uncharacterized protein YkwD
MGTLQMEIDHSLRTSMLGEGRAAEHAPRSHRVWAVLIVILVLLAALVLAARFVPAVLKDGSDLLSRLGPSSTGTTGTSTTETPNHTTYSPLVQNSGANISYPSDYGALSAYVLRLVNTDRANYSVGPVTIGDGVFAQQHADSMLQHDYFSHDDTQGFKPYMRYTLLGGTGAVEENIADARASLPYFNSTSMVEAELKSLEYTMVHDDSTCCDNAHMRNILSALHNRVSVGVAYNGTRLYLVEDFESYYIDLNFSVSDSQYVTITGTPLMSGLTAEAVYVTYDQTPTLETPAQLNGGPNTYSPGLLVGGVLPPCSFACPTFSSIMTVYADTWAFTADRVAVAFSLSDFIQHYGAGVYTVYLATGADTSTALTSISVFVG